MIVDLVYKSGVTKLHVKDQVKIIQFAEDTLNSTRFYSVKPDFENYQYKHDDSIPRSYRHVKIIIDKNLENIDDIGANNRYVTPVFEVKSWNEKTSLGFLELDDYVVVEC